MENVIGQWSWRDIYVNRDYIALNKVSVYIEMM